MGLQADDVLDVLRAIGEETRLRIVALLQHGELSVSDLTDILGQSQPRISRHLKLLAEAGVVDKHREGTWVFYELVAEGPVGALVGAIASRLGALDPTLSSDLDRLGVVRARRAAAAQEYFAGVAARWDQERSLHVPEVEVEDAIIGLAAQRPYRSLLDLGSGTGRMLQLLAHDGIEHAVGLDNSHSMLAVARANLERAEVRRADLRQGDVYSPPFAPHSFELVVLHQVLHYLDDPARAIREAARLVAHEGRLLIVDFAPHTLEFLRDEHTHRRLGFRADVIAGWLEQAGMQLAATHHLAAPPDAAATERLTVTLWLAETAAATAGWPADRDSSETEVTR